MTPRRALLITALLLALLPSCVRWNIGRNIREGCETWVGVNLNDGLEVPPEQLDSGWPSGGAKASHHLVPEVHYQPDYPLIGLAPGSSSIPRARNIEYTHAWRKVTIPLSIFHFSRIHIGERVPVHAGYPGANPSPPPAELLQKNPSRNLPYPVRPLQPRHITRSAWYTPAAIMAAPFDYLIDPALSIASTPIFWVGAGVAAGVSRLLPDNESPTTPTP